MRPKDATIESEDRGYNNLRVAHNSRSNGAKTEVSFFLEFVLVGDSSQNTLSRHIYAHLALPEDSFELTLDFIL